MDAPISAARAAFCTSWCFFSSQGSVWVHHLSLSSGPLPEGQSVVAATANRHYSGSYFSAIQILYINKKKLDQPPPEW